MQNPSYRSILINQNVCPLFISSFFTLQQSSAFSKFKWPNISQFVFSIMPHIQNLWCSTMSEFFINFQATCSCYSNSFNSFPKVFSGTANSKIWKCFLFQTCIWFFTQWILPDRFIFIRFQEFSSFSTSRDCCTSI